MSKQRRVRGTGVADGRREIFGRRGLRRAEPARDAAHGSRVHAGDDEAVDLIGRELGGLQCAVPRLLGERRVLHLAEALFPRARTIGAGRAPALDELLGRARGAEVLGDDRTVRHRTRPRPRPRRRRPATRRRSSGGRRACRTRPPGCSRCRRARCAARPRPSAARRRNRPRPPRCRGGARRGWPTRCSCRGRRGSRSRTTAHRSRCLPAPTAGRAGPPRRPGWWCPRRRRRPTGFPCPRPSRTSWRCRRGRAVGTGHSPQH